MRPSLTYVGTLDDVVERFPWQFDADINYFNQLLVRKAILGEKILINDGYLLNNSAARQAILNPSCSPLTSLIEQGFVRILSRNADLVSLPEKMAAQGVTSFNVLKNSAEWPSLKRELRKWQPLLEETDNFIPWPEKHISHGFDQMIMRLAERTPKDLSIGSVSHDQWRRVFDLYEQSNRYDKEATRTRWESAVTECLADNHQGRLSMMHLACEAYHYNFGVCLGSQSSLSKQQILVETRFSSAFADLSKVDQELQMQHVSIPGLRVPRNISMNSGPKWAELVSPFSDVGKQLRAYRQAQDDYFSGQGTEECLTAEARAYSKQLSSLFGEKQSESAVARVAIGVGFFAAGLMAAGPEVAAVLWLTENYLYPTITRKFKLRDREFFSKNTALPTQTVSSALSSVVLDPVQIKELASTIPDFK